MAIMSPGVLKFLQKLEGKGRKWDEKGLQEKKHSSCKVSDFPKSASIKYTKNSNHILERRSKFMVQSLAALRRPNQLTFTEKEELNLTPLALKIVRFAFRGCAAENSHFCIFFLF